MAIDAYLKMAAAQLRKAVLHLKEDSDGVRKNITDRENTTNKTIQDLQRQIHAAEIEMGAITDATVHRETAKHINNLRQQINQLQQQTNQEKQARMEQIQNMEGKMNQLTGKARELENQPGSF